MSNRVHVNPGDRYGQLTILAELPRVPGGRFFTVRCDCGRRDPYRIALSKLRDPRRVGQCYRCAHDATGRSKRTHGGLAGGRADPQYAAWQQMRRRCKRRTAVGDACTWAPEWDTFGGFLAHPPMGTWFQGAALCRNGDVGNYTPTNARWATRGENSRERLELTTMIRFKDDPRAYGELAGRFAADVARENGINKGTWWSRANRGWNLLDAVTIPTEGRRGGPNRRRAA